MSSYYNAWITASAAQSTGLAMLAMIALGNLATYYVVKFLPTPMQKPVRVGVAVFIALATIGLCFITL